MKTIQITIPDGCEVQIVRKEEKKELVIRTYQDLIDKDTSINGFFIDLGKIKPVNLLCSANNTKGVASSEKIAKSMLAMAQISQLMPYYGGEITNEEWDSTCPKHVIRKQYDKLYTDSTMYYYHFLAFHTKEQRGNFLKYNERLVKDYLMID